MVFDEDSVFDGKTEDLMDNLMHSTLSEIAAWMRMVELPEPTHGEPETQTFYEDDIIQDSGATQQDNQQGYHQGRKLNYTYPSPLTTLPPVALLT